MSVDILPPPPSPSCCTERERSIAAAVQLAETYRRSGRLEDALAVCDDAIGRAPELADALLQRCRILRDLHRLDDGLADIWLALDHGIDNATTWSLAGELLIEAKHFQQAQRCLTAAIRREPTSADAWLLLGDALLKQGKYAAIPCFRRAAFFAPTDAAPLLRLGQLYAQLGEYKKAVESFSKARELDSLALDAISGCGHNLISLGRLEDAEGLFNDALRANPEHLDSRLGHARLLLLRGELGRAWEAYEWRRRRPDFNLIKVGGVEWDGSPLRGKTLLVYAEQGFGDVLQFVRYIPLLAAQGAKVVLLVSIELERLCRTLDGVTEVRSSLGALPHYDYHSPLLSISRFFGTTLATLPKQIPYFHVAPDTAEPILAPLGVRLKVGVVWAGRPTHANDRHRSLTLEDILPLAGIEGVALYSLQMGPRGQDIAKVAHPAIIRDLSPRLRDFADTAAVIQNLDMVICVDTSTGHLTGALGKPVWMLIPYAPDWRWMLERDDSPWYPSMRLFRQSAPNDWSSAIQNVLEALRELSKARQTTHSEDIIVPSVFPAADGKSRFVMPVSPHYLSDLGVRYLLDRETQGIGYEYATRSFIDAHLQPGDLFIDIGAHWGIMSLQAATRWQGDVHVLACEPAPDNLPHLRKWIDANRLADTVEIIPAAIADISGRGGLRPETTMGYSLQTSADGPIPVTTVDALLAARPHLTSRRTIIKIDVEGAEKEVLDGMANLLSSGHVAAVIWEKGHTYNGPDGQQKTTAIRDRLASLGFSAWVFDSEDAAGPLHLFEGGEAVCNVFELAHSLVRQDVYGIQRIALSRQPESRALTICRTTNELLGRGLRLHSAGDVDLALQTYSEASAIDHTNADLFNNIGVALQSRGKHVAAESAYRRAIALRPYDAGAISNLGCVLRELGEVNDSIQTHNKALLLSPNNPRFLLNAAHAFGEAGLPEEAVAHYDAILRRENGNSAIRRGRATALLRMGDYASGFTALSGCAFEGGLPIGWADGTIWAGEEITGRSIFVSNGLDICSTIFLARFAPLLFQRGAEKVILECQPELQTLMEVGLQVETVPAGFAPPSDCHIYTSLAALPTLLGGGQKSLPPQVNYVLAGDRARGLRHESRIKVGLIWAESPLVKQSHWPLQSLLDIFADPRFIICSLQKGTAAAELKATGIDCIAHDIGGSFSNFLEAAGTLKEIDLLVSTDTPYAHLAAALGIPTFVLVKNACHWSWPKDGEERPWNPTAILFNILNADAKQCACETLISAMSEFADGMFR